VVDHFLGVFAGLAIGFWLGKKASLGSKNPETATALARLEETGRQVAELRKERDQTSQRAEELSRKLGALESTRDSYEKQFENEGHNLDALREKILKEVEVVANKALEKNSTQFQDRVEKGVGSLVEPLKEKIRDFEKKVEERYGEETRQVFALKEEIKRTVESNDRVSKGADILVRALRGEQKTQGDWGEMQVESLLEASGLRKNEDYVAQGEGMGLKDENGRVQKPDYLIKLPEGKRLVLDSKVSLSSWFDYCGAEAEDDKKILLAKTLGSIRAHVDDLAAKHYASNPSLKSPDFVLMFVSPEGALLSALKNDQRLFEYAWVKNIVIVGPSTALPALKTVAQLWRGERQTKNAIEIARQAGALYEEFASIFSALQELEKAMAKADEKRQEVVKRLSQGRGNVVKRVEDLKKLGVKASRQIPEQFLEEDLLELPAATEDAS
jgi:DNA recombination protein RmuC